MNQQYTVSRNYKGTLRDLKMVRSHIPRITKQTAL